MDAHGHLKEERRLHDIIYNEKLKEQALSLRNLRPQQIGTRVSKLTIEETIDTPQGPIITRK